jgi:hypothetical protein
MAKADKVELVTIGLASIAWAIFDRQSWSGAAGTLLGMAGALLLTQGLLRDVIKLALRRERSEKKRIACLCAESSIGLLLVLAGMALAALGLNQPVVASATAVLLGPPLVLVLGFIAKEYVVVIRKEKDHGSVIVW